MGRGGKRGALQSRNFYFCSNRHPAFCKNDWKKFGIDECLFSLIKFSNSITVPYRNIIVPVVKKRFHFRSLRKLSLSGEVSISRFQLPFPSKGKDFCICAFGPEPDTVIGKDMTNTVILVLSLFFYSERQKFLFLSVLHRPQRGHSHKTFWRKTLSSTV